MSKTLLFTIIGALTGLLVTQISSFSGIDNIEFALFAFTLLVASFALTWEKLPNPTLIKFLILLAIILSGITTYYYFQGYHKIHYINPLFVIGLIQLSFICTAFFQSYKTSKPHYSYADLFENAWNNHFYFLFCGLLTGAFLLILLLGTNLFKSIGIRVFEIVWNPNINPIIVLGLIGAGVGISREYEQLIFKFRSVFFALFRILAYLTAAIVIIFSLVLPFSIEALFAGKNTSQILLSIVAISIILLNAIEDKESKSLPKWANILFSVQIVLLPILASVSIYAIYLRITQYGLMPNRIIALWVALLVGLYALGYLLQLVLNKGQWSLGLARVNPPLALIWVLSIVLLISPIVDPIKLSTKNQVSRLKNELVSVEKFDFRAIKNRLGEPGEIAIKEILKWNDHPQFIQIKNKIKDAKPAKAKTLEISMIGKAPDNLKQLKSRYYRGRCNERTPCFIKSIVINEKNEKQVMVFSFNPTRNRKSYKLHSELYTYDKQWMIVKRFNSKVIDEAQKSSLIKAIKNQQPKLIKPSHMDLEFEGIQLRQ